MRPPSSIVPTIAVSAALVLVACGADEAADPGADVAYEVERVDDHSNSHIELPDDVVDEPTLYAHLADGVVDYDQRPPSGGDHAPVWLNCGLYDEAQPDELVVHALEHGAVWFAHGEGLIADQINTLRTLGRDVAGDRAVVSPHPDVPAEQVIAVAWGVRYGPTDVEDPNLIDFVERFQDSPDAPEPNVSCQGGVGEPEPF